MSQITQISADHVWKYVTRKNEGYVFIKMDHQAIYIAQWRDREKNSPRQRSVVEQENIEAKYPIS